MEDVLRSCYRAAEKGEGCELSSADIFQRLKKINRQYKCVWGKSGEFGTNTDSSGDRTLAYQVWECVSGSLRLMGR